MANLYLVKRGPKPAYHRASFHPVVLCDIHRIAENEAGFSGEHAWVWSHCGIANRGFGWLIERWNGLDLDYGSVVHGFELPDGAHAGFWRISEDFPAGVRDLVSCATWWSTRRIPEWLLELGVKYPDDDFSQQWILDEIANDGVSGFGRNRPAFWPDA